MEKLFYNNYQESPEDNVDDITKELGSFLAEKFKAKNVEFEFIKNNVTLVKAMDLDNKELRLICKKPINPSPLLESVNFREKFFYEQIAQNIPINVPKYFGCTTNGMEIMEYIPHESKKVGLNEEVDIIRTIHKTKIEAPLSIELNGEFDDPQKIIEFADSKIQQLDDLNFDKDIIENIKPAKEIIGKNIEHLNSLPKVLVHGDFWDDNLIKTSNGLFVLDWENVQMNIPQYDLATLYYTKKFIKREDVDLEEFVNMYDPSMKNFDNQKLVELSFILQTLIQVLPAVIDNIKNKVDLGWKIDWLQHCQELIKNNSEI